MNIKQIGFGLAAILAFCMGLGISTSAHAKNKATDQSPDREPYQYTIFVNSGTGGCTEFGCDVIFPEVPAGKRLVVQQVSATQFLLPGFNSSATLRIGGFGETGIRIQLIPHITLISSGTRQYVRYSQPVFGYIEAGVAPYLQTGAIGAGIDLGSTTEYFLSGYLEPAPSAD